MFSCQSARKNNNKKIKMPKNSAAEKKTRFITNRSPDTRFKLIAIYVYTKV